MLNDARAEIDKVRPFAAALGVDIRHKIGRNYARSNPLDYHVNLDPYKLVENSLRTGLRDPELARQRVRTVIGEELLHAADAKGLHEEKARTAPNESWGKFYGDHVVKVANEILGARDKAKAEGNTRLQRLIENVVRRSIGLYSGGYEQTEPIRMSFDQARQTLEGDFGQDEQARMLSQLRFELARQLIQAHQHGMTTETIPRTLLRTLGAYFKRLLQTFRAAYSRFRSGEISPALGEAMGRTEENLRGLADIYAEKNKGQHQAQDYHTQSEFHFPGEDFRLSEPEVEDPEKLPAEDKYRALQSSTFKRQDGLKGAWDYFTRQLRGFHSMVPEAGAKQAPEGTIRIQQWERYIKGLGQKNSTDAANTVRKVMDPILKVSPETHPELIDNLRKLNDQISDREKRGRAVPQKLLDQRTKLESIQNSNPLHLFQQAVLYRDLLFRSQVEIGKDSHGNPRYQQLPMGLTKDNVIDKLVDIKKQLAKLPAEQQDAVKDSLRLHYRLVRDIKNDLANRGFIIPKEMLNPYYFPHLLLEHMSGALGSPKISTQQDFRKYLINPVGSEKPIETNYVKAMMQHLVEVANHNGRQDATEDILSKIDRSDDYRRAMVDENNRRLNRGLSNKDLLPINDWERRARADGLEIFSLDKRLPLRMEAIVDRQKLADRIGKSIEGPNIAQQLRKLGVTLTADDLKMALTTDDPVKWALHPKEAEALRGVLNRAEAKSKSGYSWGDQLTRGWQKVLSAWKWWHLFSPTSAVRYNYNLMTVDLEKAFTADPYMLKKLAPAFKEVREFLKTGQYTSPEMAAAVEHDVVHSPTAHELGAMDEFPQLRDLTPAKGKLQQLGDMAKWGQNFASMRDRTFRYAKYLADLERLRDGKAVPEMALHRDLALEPTNEAKAAKNAREMFVDYNAISPAGEYMRKNLIPFYSWMEGNFRYHANLFRNFHDMSVPNKAEFFAKAAPRYAAKMLFGRATRGFLLRAAMVNGSIAAWNAWQMHQYGIKDSDLSDEDKRHLFIVTGKDPNTGKVHLMYVPTASSDIASWLGGHNFTKAFEDYMNKRYDLGHIVQHWMQGWGSDVVNKVAQSVRPEFLGTVGAVSHQDFFPNVFKPRQVPAYDQFHNTLKTIFDQPTADLVEQFRNNKFLPSKGIGDNLAQMLLQQRYRDPQQENYYAARDRADQFLQDKGLDRSPGTSNKEESMIVRNLRQSMYQGDVQNAVRFAQMLVKDYGYNSQKFAATLRSQDPLSAIPKANKAEYLKQLSDFDKEQLADAYRYVARLQAGEKSPTTAARDIFGPKAKPVVNEQALKAAIAAMQDQARREATAQMLLKRGMTVHGR